MMTEGGSIIGDELLRGGEGGAELQRHGGGEGLARGIDPLPGLGPRAQKIRVNCISAGPMQTLAARGIGGFIDDDQALRGACAARALLHAGGTGGTGVFLASEASASITGQVIYVDGGYQIMGM